MQRLVCALLAFVSLLVWGTVPQAQDTREHWLSPKDLVGDSFQARCLGMADAGAIDLTPYGVEMFWCASASLPANMTGVLQIGSSLSSALGARKGPLVAALKKPLTANTVDELLVEFISPRLHPGKDGKLKIYLGHRNPEYQQTAGIPFRDNGMVADVRNYATELLEPAVAWATTLLVENFPTTGDLNGSTQVYGWTEFNGTSCTVSSNKIQMSAATTCEARADIDLATDDMEVQATITATPEPGNEVRVGVIGRKANDTTRTYYTSHASVLSGSSEWRLGKRVAGVATTLGTNATDPVNGDIVKLRSDGSSHSLYVNNAEFVAPVTDAAITGNTRAGTIYIGNHANDVATIASWWAYDYPRARAGGKSIWFH